MSDFMVRLDGFCSWLFATSWQVSVLICAVLLAQWALRNHLAPRWRYALWLLVLVRLVMPTLPESPFSLFNLVPEPQAAMNLLASAPTMEWVGPSETPLQQSLGDDLSDRPEGAAATAISETPLPVALTNLPNTLVGSPRLGLLWLMGVLLCFTFLIGQVVSIRSWCRRLPENSDPQIDTLLEECKQRMGIRKRIAISTVPEKNSPAIMGYLKPTLLLPDGIAASLGEENLRYVLYHELSHLKRHDILANWLATFFRLLHWFNPLLWISFRRMQTDQELACDNLALTYVRPEEKKTYSQTIVALFEGTAPPQRLPGMAGILEEKSKLRRRIEMIASFKPTSRGWTVVTGMLIAALGLATLTGASTSDLEEIRTAVQNSREVVFPEGRSVGSLLISAAGQTEKPEWEFLSPAQGRVFVPEGKILKLQLSREGASDLSPLADLAPDDLYAIEFGNGGPPPDQTQYLEGLTSLKVLDLSRSDLDDNAIAFLPQLVELEELYFYGNPITDAALDSISQLPHLRVLNLLKREGITDAGLERIAEIQTLTSLNIEKASVTARGIAFLKRLPRLKELTLSRINIDDSALLQVGMIPNLEYLDLYQCKQVTDVGLGYLSNLTRLKSLELESTGVTDEGMNFLQTMTGMETLILNYTGVTDQGLPPLAGIRSLKKFEHVGTGITEGGLYKIESLRRFAVISNPDSPKVGVLFSHYTATGPSWIGHPYGYGGCTSMAEILLKHSLQVYAIYEPDSETTEALSSILRSLGLSDRMIDGTDPEALGALDVVAIHVAYNMRDDVLAALTKAVKSGVGLVNRGAMGLCAPGYHQGTQELLGVEGAAYEWHGWVEVSCPVVTSHPILGFLEPGDSYWVCAPDGYSGLIEGTPLLAPAEPITGAFTPLYIRQLGKGRIVNMQYVSNNPKSTEGMKYEDFLLRCVNWSANKPAGTKWIVDAVTPKD